MIYVLFGPGCNSCKKAFRFFEKNLIPFTKISILNIKKYPHLLIDVLSMTENGFSDILTSRSKLMDIELKMDELTVNEAIGELVENPILLKRPLIIEYNNNGAPYRLLIGYNSDDIQIFLRNVKKQ